MVAEQVDQTAGFLETMVAFLQKRCLESTSKLMVLICFGFKEFCADPMKMDCLFCSVTMSLWTMKLLLSSDALMYAIRNHHISFSLSQCNVSALTYTHDQHK